MPLESVSLPEHRRVAFIGCGVMAEAMIAGLLRENIVEPGQISASHPRADRRDELRSGYGIETFVSNADCARGEPNSGSIIVLCVKPQRLKNVVADLAGNLSPDSTIVSIVAGAKIEALSRSLGTGRVVRVMPNTPSQIGAGISVWTCPSTIDGEALAEIRTILRALGKELYVETENMVDMATSLSATGPTFTFMVMEALTDAGVHLGFSREIAKELVQETMLGSVKFAMESHKHPAELRNMVTSPGGTSAEAIYQMEKGGLRTVLSKAVYAAYKRAVGLGKDR
jgi:pyrroline-5-carboxylate reductase